LRARVKQSHRSGDFAFQYLKDASRRCVPTSATPFETLSILAASASVHQARLHGRYEWRESTRSKDAARHCYKEVLPMSASCFSRFNRTSLLFACLFFSCTSSAQLLTALQPSAELNWTAGCRVPRCFTEAVAIDGDTIVGANGNLAISTRSGTTWVLTQELPNPDYPNPALSRLSWIGAPVGLQGDLLLATGSSGKFGYVPVVYVFARAGATWTHVQTLALPRSEDLNNIQIKAIAIERSIVAINGVRGNLSDVPTQTRALIDIYTRRSDGKLQRQGQITPPTASNAPNGYSLAVQGNRLFVGDPHADAGSGRVFVYERGSRGWRLIDQLAAADAVPAAGFGTAISVSGNTVAISAPARPNFDSPLHIGGVYLFQRTATSWAQMQLLVRPEFDPPGDIDDEPAADARFGDTLGLSGDRLVVEWHATYGDAGLPPAAYLYERRGVWAPVAQLRPEFSFPRRVVLSGSTAVTTTSSDSYATPQSVFELPELWTLPPRVE
jgi:hypothetical protein